MLMICQCCGAVIHDKGRECKNCGVGLALNSPSIIADLEALESPLQVVANEEPLLVERVVTNRLLSTLEEACPEQIVNKKTDQPVNSVETLKGLEPNKSNSVSISIGQTTGHSKNDSAKTKDPFDFFDNMSNAIEHINTSENYPVLEEEVEQSPLKPKEDPSLDKLFQPNNLTQSSSNLDQFQERSSNNSLNKPDTNNSIKYAKDPITQSTARDDDAFVLKIPKKSLTIAGFVSLIVISLFLFGVNKSDQTPSTIPVSHESSSIPEVAVHPKSAIALRGTMLNRIKANQLNGTWLVHFRSETDFDKMTIRTDGETFEGKGIAEYNEGKSNFNFKIKDGKLIKPNKISYTKIFDTTSRQNGAPVNPIYFEGTLTKVSDSISAKGKFQTLYRTGKFNNKKETMRSGNWSAKLIGPPATDISSQSNEQAPIEFFLNTFKDLFNNVQQTIYSMPMHSKLMFLAFAMLALSVVVVIVSLKLFSPSGLLNRWEKEKYIPSSFKKQHQEMLNRFGKKYTPGSVPLGRRLEWHWWWPFSAKYLTMPPEERQMNPNILAIGSSKKGKSRLIASMIAKDIEADDRAVVVIDPDSSLTDLLIEHIASNSKLHKHAQRILIVDPTEEASEIYTYNPLELPADGNLQSAANSFVNGFKAMYTVPEGQQSQWNDQTANILRNSALVLMLNGRTLIDLPTLLQDNDFRDLMLEKLERQKDKSCEHTVVLDTWQQYKKLARTDQWITWVEPILNRLGSTLGDGRIRRIIDKPVGDLDLKQIISNKMVLFLRIPNGELDKNANILASLIITGIQNASLSLNKKTRANQKSVALYIEEIDNFVDKDTIEKIAKDSQRYQIGCTGSIKSLQHLPKEFRSKLVDSMGMVAAFALPKEDAEMMGKQMFRVDGRKTKFKTLMNFLNPINTSPQFELIMDEEKLNVDRLAGQAERTFFCYRTGTEAGVFKLKTPEFSNPDPKKINQAIIDKIWDIKAL